MKMRGHLLWLVSASLARDYDIGLGACSFSTYNDLKESVLNQTCDGSPCDFTSNETCSYVREFCSDRYVASEYVNYYWCNHDDEWVAVGFPMILILLALYVVKMLWSTVDEFLDKAMLDMIGLIQVPDKIAVVTLIALGGNTPVIGIGMSALIWHHSWRLWLGVNLSIALIYVTGLLGVSFIRFKVQPEEKLAKISLMFLVFLCIFFSIIVIGDNLSIWAAITLMILHMAFVSIVWCTSDRNQLNAQLLVAVRKDVGKEEKFRKHSMSKRHMGKRRSTTNIVNFSKKKFKVLDNNAIQVWKLGDGELKMSDLDYLASDEDSRNAKHANSSSPSYQMSEFNKKDNTFRAPLLDNTSSGRAVIINRNSSRLQKFLPHHSSMKRVDDEEHDHEHNHNIIFELEPHPLLDLFSDDLGCCSRFLLILELPISILRMLTIPETDRLTWNVGQRLRNTISIVLGVLLVTWFGIWETRGFGHYRWPNDFYLFVVMCSVSSFVALLFWFSTSPEKVPNRYAYFALQFYAFIVSFVWVYELATQIVNICVFFTLSFEYAQGLWLGFMILGPVVCLPDILNFIVSACDEYNEHIEIDLSTPLMTLIVGLWIPLLVRQLVVGTPLQIQIKVFLPEVCTLLALSAIMLLVVLHQKLYIGKWRPRIGVILLLIYGVCCVFSFIHNFGLNY